MTQPRNPVAFATGQRRRALIRQLLLEHATRCPLGRPLTARALQAALRAHGEPLALSSIHWHLSQIRLAADIERLDAELGHKSSNSSGPDTLLGCD
ncbi:MAG: hypothetical protein ACP5P4_12255 [Steroidobacteraceae bacterium]